jgi:hypothetical protein
MMIDNLFGSVTLHAGLHVGETAAQLKDPGLLDQASDKQMM